MTMNNPSIADADEWRPYCGYAYPTEKTAGVPIVCDRPVHDVRKEKHHNEATGFSWWQSNQGGSNDQD